MSPENRLLSEPPSITMSAARTKSSKRPFLKLDRELGASISSIIRVENRRVLNQTAFRLSASRMRYDDDWVGKLSDTIAAGYRQGLAESTLIDAIDAERPFLSRHQGATADWMLGLLSGTDRRSLVQFADDQGVSKGYASKLRDQVAKSIFQRFKK